MLEEEVACAEGGGAGEDCDHGRSAAATVGAVEELPSRRVVSEALTRVAEPSDRIGGED